MEAEWARKIGTGDSAPTGLLRQLLVPAQRDPLGHELRRELEPLRPAAIGLEDDGVLLPLPLSRRAGLELRRDREGAVARERDLAAGPFIAVGRVDAGDAAPRQPLRHD